MPKYERYPNEDPRAAAKRIARNKAKKNPDAVKTKGDMIANVMPSAKNLGY